MMLMQIKNVKKICLKMEALGKKCLLHNVPLGNQQKPAEANRRWITSPFWGLRPNCSTVLKWGNWLRFLYRVIMYIFTLVFAKIPEYSSVFPPWIVDTIFITLFYFIFLWYCGLNSGPSPSATFFVKGFCEIGSHELFAWAGFRLYPSYLCLLGS
jgi:hypothetical protein